MRQLLFNIFLFLVSITVFCFAAPQVSTSKAHHSNTPLIIEPIKQAPKDTTSMEWKKDSTLQASTVFLLEKMAY